MTEAPLSLVDRMLVEGLSDRVDESSVSLFALDLDPLSAADRRATVLGAIAEVLVVDRVDREHLAAGLGR